MKKVLTILAFAASFVVSSIAVAQQQYTLTDLGALPGDNFSYAWGISPNGKIAGESSGTVERGFLWDNGVFTNLGGLGGTYTSAYGVNDSGQLVGLSRNTAGRLHAFLWQAGVIQDLGTLGGNTSVATAINPGGLVVGWAENTIGIQRAFLWNSGVMQDLGTLGGSNSIASAINGSGQIAGFSQTSYGEQHAFLWTGGTMQDLGTLPGGNRTDGYGLNSFGTVVGLAYTSNSTRPFMWKNGSIQDLGVISGASYGWALAVNDNDQVVGSMEGLPGGSRGFLWEQGVMYSLESLVDSSGQGWRIWTAATINNNGYIVGYGTDPLGRDRAILLKPLPVVTTLQATGDTFIKDNTPNRNFGSALILKDTPLVNGQNRSLIQFDPVAVSDFVGTRTVTSAKLRLYIEVNSNNWGANGNSVAVHRMLHSWTEGGATWNCPDDTDLGNNLPNGALWDMTNSANWPFVATPTATVLHTNGLVGWIEFDVTVDVRAFMAGTASDYGWLLKKVDDYAPGSVQYSSREDGNPPELVITAG